MGVSTAEFDASKGVWDEKAFGDIKSGTTQVKKVMINGVEVWSAGIISAATVDNQGSGPISGNPAGNYTFNVIGTDGVGAGGQIIGSVSFTRRLTGVISIVDGGLGHVVGDILELEQAGGVTWPINPEIEVTAI